MVEGYVQERNNYMELIKEEYQIIDKHLDIISKFNKERKKYEIESSFALKVALIDSYVQKYQKIIIDSQKRISSLEECVENLDQDFFICEDEEDD